MTARVLHVVVGPPEHGVVRHARRVATACGHGLLTRDTPEKVELADLTGHDVVHLAFTDRLFGPSCDVAAAAFTRVATLVAAAGAALSVTLHDLPMGESERTQRRRRAYREVVAHARGLVVSSRHELALAEHLGDAAWSRQVVPLPVDPVEPDPVQLGAAPPAAGRDVVILGFVHPDKGHEHTLAETPPGGTVVALGGPAAGHEELPAALAAEAHRLGRAWRLTGHVPDDALGAALRDAAVPVAPHRHVSASGSIATWLAHGRRPLVPDTRYARELEAAWPGTLRRYDPDVPGDLRRAIEASWRDPSLTRLGAGVATGPSTAEVAARYDRHLRACTPPAAIPADRGWVVPGNRWDLLAAVADPPPPTVSVVIPYFDAQERLDLVLTALTRQTHPADRLQVIVADDGSPRAPDLAAASALDVRTVRQDDRGFRAGAARTLGASVADGDVLLFLDGDTVPEPGYVRALSRLPALTPDALVVGRRRHADIESIRAWLDGTAPAPTALPEPGWLADGLARTGDLLHADERSYRYVISAVLGCHRDLFTELGGFDAEFVAYGGEDWELASRAWNAGAVLAHVAGAVAWHVGPDWAGRAGRPADKAAEKAAEDRLIARLVPDPVVRGPGAHRYPRAVLLADDRDAARAAEALRGGSIDGGLWLGGSRLARELDDPRVRAGSPPADVLARARTVVHLGGLATAADLLELVDGDGTVGTVSGPAGRARTTRATARARRWASAVGIDHDQLADRLFGHRDVAGR